MIRPGYCEACWLAETDKQELDALMRAGRLPWGTLRRYGLSVYQAYRHRRHLGRTVRMRYYADPEWGRRKASVARIKRYWWKPGQSGNPAGRPRGAKDKRPRRKPSGIFEAIRQERKERAERLRLAHLAEFEE